MKFVWVRPFTTFFLILVVGLFGILMLGISRAEALASANAASIKDQVALGVPATVYVVGSPLVLQQTPISFPTIPQPPHCK